MNYIEKTYEEIFESMLQDSLAKGLISHAGEFQSYIANKDDISNYYVMDKSVIAQLIAKVYKDITSAYESAKVEFAEGDDLDSIGKIVGINRPQATHSEVTCTFTISQAAEENISIPEGIIVSTASGVKFTTVESLFIAAGETETNVLCRAVEAGLGSRVIENTINRVISELPYTLRVNNPNSTTGGSEAYTDDEYRYLLMNWRKINLKGSLEAYDYYFSNFDGLDSYKIVPNWNGTGTVKVILDPGTDLQLNKAYNDLQNSVVQASEDITMFAPNEKTIDIYAIVNVDIDQINPYSSIEKDEIRARIISAIKVFIDGGYTNNGSYYKGLVLGEDFIPHKLGVFLDHEIPELKNIDFNYPEDYILIQDEEIGVSNEITIEMI